MRTGKMWGGVLWCHSYPPSIHPALLLGSGCDLHTNQSAYYVFNVVYTHKSLKKTALSQQKVVAC